MGFSKSSVKRKVHSNTSYLKKQEKHQINNLTLHLKQQEKKKLRTPKLVKGKKS